MAFDRNAVYGARWSAPSTAHPEGAFINRTSPTADDGSYLEEQWINSFSALPEALIQSAGITLSGNPDEVGNSQYMEGLVEQVSGRSMNYDCSGPANAYVLSVRTSQYGPQSYFDGMSVEFKPNVTNTGASSVNVNALGVINITNTSTGGELVINQPVRLRYNSTTGQFEIMAKVNNAVQVTTSAENGGTPDQTFEAINFRSSAFSSGPQGNITYAVTAGTAEVFNFRHNGTNDPKWEWSSALYGDSLILETASANNAELKVLGDFQSYGLTGTTFYRVPNVNEFFSNRGVATSWNQFIPSSAGGTTVFRSFVTNTLTDGVTTSVSFPEVFAVAPVSVSVTPSAASGSVGYWYVNNISATSFDLTNETGTNQAFFIMVMGNST
jgi:hypothetical protein